MTIGTTKFNLVTGNQTLVILRDNGVGYDVKSDGTPNEDIYSEAQFYVDTHNDGNNLLYRFRSVSEPTKYLAASGSQIVLKDVPRRMTAFDDSYDFFVLGGSKDYRNYMYKNSPVGSPLFMSTDNANDVILAGSSSLFQLRDVPGNATSFSLMSTPDYPAGAFEEFFKETNNGATISIEIEEESVPGKLIVSERISISEE